MNDNAIEAIHEAAEQVADAIGTHRPRAGRASPQRSRGPRRQRNGNTLIIPSAAELDQRIRDCEEELRALRRLRRMAGLAERAEKARKGRPPLKEVQRA